MKGQPKYVSSANGVRSARRRLRTDGVEPEIQAKLDKACVVPHLHPRSTRNYIFKEEFDVVSSS